MSSSSTNQDLIQFFVRAPSAVLALVNEALPASPFALLSYVRVQPIFAVGAYFPCCAGAARRNQFDWVDHASRDRPRSVGATEGGPRAHPDQPKQQVSLKKVHRLVWPQVCVKARAFRDFAIEAWNPYDARLKYQGICPSRTDHADDDASS